MTRTLPDIQVANRCVFLKPDLCGSPAPFLINGYSYCDAHAVIVLGDPRNLQDSGFTVEVKRAHRPGKEVR